MLVLERLKPLLLNQIHRLEYFCIHAYSVRAIFQSLCDRICLYFRLLIDSIGLCLSYLECSLLEYQERDAEGLRKPDYHIYDRQEESHRSDRMRENKLLDEHDNLFDVEYNYHMAYEIPLSISSNSQNIYMSLLDKVLTYQRRLSSRILQCRRDPYKAWPKHNINQDLAQYA